MSIFKVDEKKRHCLTRIHKLTDWAEPDVSILVYYPERYVLLAAQSSAKSIVEEVRRLLDKEFQTGEEWKEWTLKIEESANKDLPRALLSLKY